MTYRYTLIALITLSMACSGSDTEGEGDNTGLTAQEELCADYPEGIQCPTLPAPPTLEDGTNFSDWAPKECPPGYMAEFGKDNCISIGDPCPEGDWPENLPTSNVKYVTPGGTGDGSSPQNAAGSIQQMVSGSSSGATIALSKGTFNEAIEVRGAQNIIGACARDTVIQGPPGSVWSDATVKFSGVGDASLKNVTVTGNRAGIVIYENQNPITISGVVIEAVKGLGLFMENGQAEIDRIIIQDTQGQADGTTGQGIQMNSGSTLTLSRALLSGNRDVGMFVASEDTTVTASDVVIENTQSAADGTGGRGIGVQGGASLTLSRALLSGNRDVGMQVSSAGTTVTASDVVIENTQSAADGTYGRGINVRKGATLTLSHALLSGNCEVGMVVSHAGTTVTGSDVVIENTQSQADGILGRGIDVQEGASLTLFRALLSGNRDVGMFVSHAGTTVAASDIVIENTKVAACAEDPLLDCPNAGAGFGDGMLVLGGAEISLENFTLQDNARVALYAYDVTGLDDGSLGDLTGAPILTAKNGTIINNQYGINIRGDSVTPSDFTMVACYDNEKTVDGCYSDMELSVPGPSSMTDSSN
jgi:hypothetical protein